MQQRPQPSQSFQRRSSDQNPDSGRGSDSNPDEIGTAKSGLNSLKRIRDLCEHHLSVGSEAEEHYRKVCRALVSESVELALFLEKAQKQEELHNEELHKLAQRDWVSHCLAEKGSAKMTTS